MYIFLVLVFLLIALAVSISWTIPHGGLWAPSSRKAIRSMLSLAGLKPGELLYDLGCGDGRILVAAARDFQARAVGIELDPLRYAWCWLRIRLLGLSEQVKLIRGNLFTVDTSQADVVVVYLLPGALKKLESKLLRELSPGTRVVSNTFIFPGMVPVAQEGKTRLYEFCPQYTLRESLRAQLLSSKDR
jgi:precorrin-6B methylase 2